MNADSFFKVQGGHSEGLLSSTTRSDDGGFGFQSTNPLSFTDAQADAYRADLSLGFGDDSKGHRGRLSLYAQNRDAGYSAPGQSTIKDTEQYGGTFKMPVTSRLNVAAKADQSTEDQGFEHRAIELDLGYKVTDKWSLSTGVRNDL